MRLITIPVSHFCEKARWALDLAGAPYVEERWAPGLHRLRLAPLRATTAPVLVSDGVVLRESSEIVAHADALGGLGLLGAGVAERAEIRRWVRRLDERLGPPARLLAYGGVLDEPSSFVALAGTQLGRVQAGALRAARPALTRLLRAHFAISERSMARAHEDLDGELGAADAQRAGGPYLVGDRFTAADLTFAALGAPLVFPEQYGARTPPVDALPPAMRDDVRRWRGTPSGAAVLELYARHRQPAPRDRPAASVMP